MLDIEGKVGRQEQGNERASELCERTGRKSARRPRKRWRGAERSPAARDHIPIARTVVTMARTTAGPLPKWAAQYQFRSEARQPAPRVWREISFCGTVADKLGEL